jgi:hypothetical protein
MIPARNASLAGMQGSTSVIFVTIQRDNIRTSKTEMNKAVTMLPKCQMFAVSYESLHIFIADQ